MLMAAAQGAPAERLYKSWAHSNRANFRQRASGSSLMPVVAFFSKELVAAGVAFLKSVMRQHESAISGKVTWKVDWIGFLASQRQIRLC